jgi:alpha,alpha-trehalose phosphorylase
MVTDTELERRSAQTAGGDGPAVRSIGHHDRHGQFHIDNQRADEYTAVKNDNIYTNLMAQRNLPQSTWRCATGTRRRTWA